MNSRLLKAAIVKSGLSREELAKKIGISTTTLSYKISGKRVWTRDNMYSILAKNKNTAERIISRSLLVELLLFKLRTACI